MLIESIGIAGVGPFREPVTVGPLAAGLNILAQPNEWGKSTVVHALCRALFDKYSSLTEEIKQMRPAGTSLSPSIDLTFTAQGGRYRLQKRFLEGKASVLSRWSGAAWERTDESDKADQRVRELLGAPVLDNQKAKPETWGLIRYLWCRQDEPADWPCWEGDCGEAARRKLATVEIDPLLRGLAERLECLGGMQFTARGAVKRGSPLQLAEAEREAAEAELTELARRRADLEELDRQYAAVVAELPRLDRERAERAAEAAGLRTQAEAAELLKGKIALANLEFEQAEAALQSVHGEREKLAQTASDLAAEELVQAESRSRVEEWQATAQRLEEKIEAARGAARLREQVRGERQEQLERVRGLLQSRQRAERLAALLLAQGHVAGSARAVEACEQRLAGLAALTESELKRGRELERQLAGQRAQLSAAGLAVRLEPAAAARVFHAADGAAPAGVELAAGASLKLSAARSLGLELEGWGRIVIESGAEETAELQRKIAETAAQLSALLAKAGAAALADAEAGVAQARQWASQRDVARAELAAHLAEWKSPAALAAALAKAQTEHAQARARYQFTEDDERQSEISLQVEEQKLAAAETAAKKDEKGHAQEMDRLRAELEAARARSAEEAQRVAVSAGRLVMLAGQRASLAERHAGGLEPALAEAQKQFIRAEARVAALRAELPPQAGTMAERAARAARAATEVEAEAQRRQREADRLKTMLEERGGEGLHAREADAGERLSAARKRADSLRREGLAARLLRELIQRREQASIRAVLSPLEERLTQAFALLTGVAGRRVWFDENLAVQGVGARREEMLPFDCLSRGAREQLLLALRAAIAQEVAEKEGPQCLVFDDVLVHTDATRHENVLDFLQTLSSQVQVLLLTCHAERYRGLGHMVPVAR